MPNQSPNPNKNPRTFAIGDIHGHHRQLVSLIDAIAPSKDDTLIFLGDYVDRGDASKAVLDEIIALQAVCNVIMLKGNHEVMMVEAFEFAKDNETGRHSLATGWLRYGGTETLASYQEDGYQDVAKQLLSNRPFNELNLPNALTEHLAILDALPLYHITDTHIFVHASPRLDMDIERQDEIYLLWRRASKRDAELNYEHISGKTIICGHTAQYNGMPNRLSAKNIIIDTGCYETGWLTAINVDTEQFIQARHDYYRVLESDCHIN